MDDQMNYQQNSNEEMELRDIIAVIWQYRLTILIVFLIVVVAATCYSFLQKPVFNMTATISLGNYNSALYTNPQGAKEILLSDTLINGVIKELGLDISPADVQDLKNNITVVPVKDTNYLQISVKNSSREVGKKLIEQLINDFIKASKHDYENHYRLLTEQIQTTERLLNEKDDQLAIAKKLIAILEANPSVNSVENQIKIDNLYNYLQHNDAQRMEILDRYLNLQKEKDTLEPAKVINSVNVPQNPESPKRKVIISLAMVFGVMIGLFIAFIRDYFHRNPLNLKELSR